MATTPRKTTTTAKGKTAAAKKPAAAAKTKTAVKTTAKPKAAPKSTAKPKTAAKPATAKTPARRAAPKNKAPERIWLKNYPEGMPAEIEPLKYNSISDVLLEACNTYSAKPAYTCMGKTMTYGEVEAMSAKFAAFFQSKRLLKGTRIAIMMPNVLQYPVAMMAILRAGYTVVNVNPLYTARELQHQLNDAGVEAIVVLENFASTVQDVIGNTQVKHVVVASMGDLLGLKGLLVNFVVRNVKKMVPAWSLPGHTTFNDAISAGTGVQLKPAETAKTDVAFLQYTGGTTGVSKGATLLHSNVLANVEQNRNWVQPVFKNNGKPDDLTYICALPLYHIFALTINALMGMQLGARNILIPNPRDIPGFVKELQAHKFHIFPGLNTLYNGLMNNEDFKKLDFGPLMLTLGGGMAVQRAVAERWKKLTGVAIHEGYGLSETSPVATANSFDNPEYTGTIGLPLPSTEIAIRDEDGKDVAIGEEGEICIRGPQVMAGYWQRDDETANVMTADGFFKSGDVGIMDDGGYVRIVDRKKDMILVSGFNVYPTEIEDVVALHPGVMEAAAIGVPDEKSGEAVKLFVVKKDAGLTEEGLAAHCKENLTGYKRPRHIEFRDDLPKTNVGKILRRELRE